MFLGVNGLKLFSKGAWRGDLEKGSTDFGLLSIGKKLLGHSSSRSLGMGTVTDGQNPILGQWWKSLWEKNLRIFLIIILLLIKENNVNKSKKNQIK